MKSLKKSKSKKYKLNKLFNKYCKNKKGLSKRDITKLIREEYKDNHSNNIIISLMNIWGVKIDGKYLQKNFIQNLMVFLEININIFYI